MFVSTILSLLMWNISVSTVSAQENSAKNASKVSVPKVVSIAFLVDSEHNKDEMQHYMELLQKNISAEKYAVGMSSNNVVVGSGTVESVSVALQELLKRRDVDIIVTTGAVGAKVAADAGRDRVGLAKPVVAATVFEPIAQGIVGSWQQNTSEIRNFTFSAVPYQLLNDLETFATISDITSVGVVLDQSVKATCVVNLFDYLKTASASIRDVTLLPVSEQAEIVLQEVATTTTEYKGVYVTNIQELPLAKHQQLFAGLHDMKMPSFGYSARATEMGAFASILPKNTNELLDAHFVSTVVSVLDGNKAQDISVWVQPVPVLSINADIMGSLNYWPKWNYLMEASMLEAQKTDPRSLQSLLAQAKTQGVSLDLVQADKDSMALALEWQKLRASYLPQVEASVQGKFIDRDQRIQPLQLTTQSDVWADVRLEQAIWSYEKLAQMKMNETEQAVQRLDIQLLQNQILEDISRVYWQISVVQGNINVVKEQISLLRKQANLVKRSTPIVNAKKPVATVSHQVDAEQIQMNIQQLQSQLFSLQAEEQYLQNVIKNILNQVQELQFSTGLVPTEFSKVEENLFQYLSNPVLFQQIVPILQSIAIENSVSLQKQQAEMTGIEQKITTSKYAYWSPEVGFSANIRQHMYRSNVNFYQNLNAYNSFVDAVAANSDLNISPSLYKINAPIMRNNTDWMVGAYMTLPLFDGMYRKNNLNQNYVEQSKKETEGQIISRDLQTDVYNSLLQCSSIYQRMQIQQSTITMLEKSLQTSMQQYEMGVLPWLEMSIANNQVLQAKQQYQSQKGLLHQELYHLQALLGYLAGTGQGQQQMLDKIVSTVQAKGFTVPTPK